MMDRTRQDGDQKPREPIASIAKSIAAHPFMLPARRICEPRAVRADGLDARAPETLSIAFVSFSQIDFVTTNGQSATIVDSRYIAPQPSALDLVEEDTVRQLVVPGAVPTVDAFVSTIENVCMTLSPHIICVSELAFPMTSNSFVSLQASQAMSSLANQYQCIIVAGSAHDIRTSYNTGLIFVPGTNGPVSYYKQVAAWKAQGELISVPGKRITPIIEAFRLRIGVLLCLDICDYTAVSGLVQGSAEIVLCPAHSGKFRSLSDSAMEFSRLTKGMVALVNSHSDNSPFPVRVFSNGSRMPVQVVPDVMPAGVRGSCWILERPLNVAELRDRVISRFEEHRDTQAVWLYGDQRMPRPLTMPRSRMRRHPQP